MEFSPNLTPREMFEFGSFGGTYWRPIYSSVTKKNYQNVYKKYSFLKDLDKNLVSSCVCDSTKNRYKVNSGSSLVMWENNEWITKEHPYGWVHWYCDYYSGKRCKDDEYQIKRWNNIAGVNGRWRKQLINIIKKKKKKWNDISVSPKIRQLLQHWGYVLTEKDFNHVY
jgi:hypothetical protein